MIAAIDYNVCLNRNVSSTPFAIISLIRQPSANERGLRMQEIQYILGHRKQSTTERHYAETLYDQVAQSLSNAFKHSP